MDFTREPIIETVITPKEGCKLVVRSSKNSGQEEYFVDAVEVVSFGNSFFFRSLERPKSFLVPSSDYEILEVREARMVLKNVGLDRSIKIGGGRESPVKPIKEVFQEKNDFEINVPEFTAPVEQVVKEVAEISPLEGSRQEKKRERRRHYRRRRGRDEPLAKDTEETSLEEANQEGSADHPPEEILNDKKALSESQMTTTILSTLLPPPPTLISETMARYKDNALFKGAFFVKEDREAEEDKESEIDDQIENSSFFISTNEEDLSVPDHEPALFSEASGSFEVEETKPDELIETSKEEPSLDEINEEFKDTSKDLSSGL